MQKNSSTGRMSSGGSLQPPSPKQDVQTPNTEAEDTQNSIPFPLLDVNHPLAEGADLVFATPQGDRYYAHKQVVTLWSRQFKATFGQSIPTEFSGRVVCRVQEPSSNLELLLGCMYPSPASLEIQEETIEAILLLADKYDVPGAFHQIDRWLMSRPYMVMPYHHWRTLPNQLKMLHLNDAAQKFYLFVQHKGSQEFVEYMEQMEFPESCIQFVYKGMTHVGKNAFKKLSWAARLWLEFFAEDPELINSSGIGLGKLPPTSDKSFSHSISQSGNFNNSSAIGGSYRGNGQDTQNEISKRHGRATSNVNGHGALSVRGRNGSEQNLASFESNLNGSKTANLSAPNSPRNGNVSPMKIKPGKSPFNLK